MSLRSFDSKSCVECYEQSELNKITYNNISYLLCDDCYNDHMEENANDVE